MSALFEDSRQDMTRDEFVSSIARLAGSVYDFRERFWKSPDCHIPTTEEYLATLRARLPFLIEEMGEHAQQLNKGVLDEAALEMADVAFVAIGSVLSLDGHGSEACHQVAKKNDAKTLDTHVIDESSGKLVRRARAQ